MSGIVGLVEWSQPDEARARAEGVLAALSARASGEPELYAAPPPARGPARLPAVLLGHRPARPDATDPAVRQPLPGADGLVWIVLDGELHNRSELRDELRRLGFRFRSECDAELAINAYLAWGAECVGRFNGRFALGVYDARDRSLLLARDRFGVRPLYWWADDRRLLFASEIAALPAHPAVPRRADPAAVYRFLALQIADCDERTFLAGVRAVPAGGRVKLRIPVDEAPVRPEAEAARWYLPAADPAIAELPDDKRAEMFRSALAESVRLRTASDGPVGVMLSGGPASSALAALAAGEPTGSAPPLLTAPDPRFPGAAAGARSLADHLGGTLLETTGAAGPDAAEFERLVRRLQEPFAGRAGWVAWRLAEAAAGRGLRAMLTGVGAGPLLGGTAGARALACVELLYSGRWGELAGELRAWLDRGGRWRRLPVSALLPRSRRQSLHEHRRRPAWLDFGFVLTHRGRCWPTPPAALPAGAGAPAEESRWAVAVSPVPTVLRVLDRCTAGFGVEVRLPFLDHHVVELAAVLPVQDRIAGGANKAILRRAFADRLPTAVFAPPPPRPAGTPPPGVPLDRLTPMLDDLFASRDVEDAGWFEPAALRRHWRSIRDGAVSPGPEPVQWASLLLWRRMLLVGR
jgi:asparagine synthase (glutamine-hydrolysing)